MRFFLLVLLLCSVIGIGYEMIETGHDNWTVYVAESIDILILLLLMWRLWRENSPKKDEATTRPGREVSQKTVPTPPPRPAVVFPQYPVSTLDLVDDMIESLRVRNRNSKGKE